MMTFLVADGSKKVSLGRPNMLIFNFFRGFQFRDPPFSDFEYTEVMVQMLPRGAQRGYLAKAK